MGRQKKSTVGIRKYGTKSNYSQKDLDEALDKIKNCKMSQRDAAKLYKIPRSTIKYKLKGQHSKPVGKPIAFSESEEQIFLNHIIALADLGIPVGMHDLRLIIKRYLHDQKRTIKTFKNNMPGWEWGKNFLDRHPEIRQRIAHNISRKRAQINKEMIENFFEHLKTELMDVPPENLYNFDETGFHDNPKKAKLLFRRSCRSPEIIKNATKSCFTTMFCGNAIGEFLPPFIIYKAKQKWSNWLDGAPAGTRMAVTKSGWIDAEIFDEWFQSLVLPVLKAKPGKKAIIGDNLCSHISVKTLQLCEENNIKFICLIPNSTHLLQPLDVAYFSSLKNKWRSVLNDWRNTRSGKIASALPKTIFAALLKKSLELAADTAGPNLSAGFKATGLYPCDVNVPLNKLPDYGKPIENIRESVGESFKRYIEDLRNNDLGVKQTLKFQIPVVAGKSVSVEEIQKYIEQREGSKKKPKISNTKKRGRPAGIKKGQAKKKKLSHRKNEPQPSESGQENCVNADENMNEQQDDDIENSQNVGNILCTNTDDIFNECEKRPQEAEIIQEGEMGLDRAHEENYTIAIYEVQNNGRLELQIINNMSKVLNRFCIINYEGTLFPGRIIQANHPKYRVSVMQKAEEGWIWPSSIEITSVNDTNIIRVLNDTNIQRKKGYFVIEDDFLAMEWGD